ncbi:hypothetical protein APA386B_1P143 (plasmid) [Acetobacter pasteurianus 386B]|nr:hypothetical protein APA386B_1P143 [Acetobacter pasteurianus 386B]
MTDLLNNLNRKVSGKPTAPETTSSEEDGGIPDELMGIILEILLLTRANSDRSELHLNT